LYPFKLEPLVIGTNRSGLARQFRSRSIADAQRLKIDLINLSPAGGFVSPFQVAIYGGTVLASPFIFYFAATFIFPALKLRERKYIYRGLAFGGDCFSSACLLLLRLDAVGAGRGADVIPTGSVSAPFSGAEDYIGFVCKFLLGMGLGFELPVVISDARENRYSRLSYALQGAPYVIVINLILGAVLTTPNR